MEDQTPARIQFGDTALVLEYWECMRRRGSLEPEKYLMLAVLKDALLDFTRNREFDDRRFKSAHSWFFIERRQHLFSFETICEFLNLNPAFIRRQLGALEQNRHRPTHKPTIRSWKKRNKRSDRHERM